MGKEEEIVSQSEIAEPRHYENYDEWFEVYKNSESSKEHLPSPDALSKMTVGDRIAAVHYRPVAMYLGYLRLRMLSAEGRLPNDSSGPMR